MKKANIKAIVNANIILGNEILEGYSVLFDNAVVKIEKGGHYVASDMEEVVDAKGKYLSPGFIDIHIHGCSGNDTMDDNDSSILNISRDIAATGVTAFLPTTMTMEMARIEKTVSRIRSLMNGGPGAEILGCHLEGPFISDEYKGAQDGRYIRELNFKYIEDFAEVIKIAVIAPEKEGTEQFIEDCSKRGIISAIGHTKATYSQAMKAIEKGVSHSTHTFNAMAPLHHREPGAIGAVMDSSVSCELIADNIHVNPAVQRILLKVKGIDRIILVTDAMRACLLKDGEYELGGQRVLVKGGAARLPGGNLAGSVLTINKALKNFRNNTGVSFTEAIKTVTENPARLLKLYNRKGSIAVGKDADLTLLDEEFNIYSTYVKGNKVYERFSHVNSII